MFEICRKEDPSFIFLSEPWLFQSDLPLATRLFLADYNYSLASDDLLDPELSLRARKANGGVLVFWKSHLDPYITVINIQSSSFLILLFNHPNYVKTIHAAVYLPTAGLENNFVEEPNLKLLLTFLLMNTLMPLYLFVEMPMHQ